MILFFGCSLQRLHPGRQRGRLRLECFSAHDVDHHPPHPPLLILLFFLRSRVECNSAKESCLFTIIGMMEWCDGNGPRRSARPQGQLPSSARQPRSSVAGRGELRSHQNSNQRVMHRTFVLPNLRSAVSEMRPMKLLAASSTRPPATTLWKKPAVWVNADALLNAGPALALMLLLCPNKLK